MPTTTIADHKRKQLIYNLDEAHHDATFGGNGLTLYKEAADEIRHLLNYIEQLRDRLHWVNEDFLETKLRLELIQNAQRKREQHDD